MPRDRRRLQDMLQAAQGACTFLGTATLNELEGDPLRLAAICYQLVILGEAANAVSTEFQAAHPQLPWVQMRGLRNFVTHEYHHLDVEIIHAVLTRNLPAVIVELQRLTAPD